jgi:hypothetical protein
MYMVRQLFRSVLWGKFCVILDERGRSPLCMLRCLLKSMSWVKPFRHTSQEKRLSLVCILWCLFRLQLWEKLFLHTLHEKGFSPLCVLRCMIRLARWGTFSYTFRKKNISLHCVLWDASLAERNQWTSCYIFCKKLVVLQCVYGDEFSSL